MPPTLCPKCASTDIDTDGARGEAVCTNCGHVLEECAIVSEVQFSENAGGQSSVVGQFVPDSGVSSFRGGPGYSGFAKDSREVTLANGRRITQHIAGLLRLVNHHVDVAQRFFQQAVQRNFIQGRRTHTVVAVCLYIVCRKQKTSHMLIDFAEVLQTDVYELGNVFLKFCKLLHIKLDPIDPSLYIHRFASMLEFAEKTQQVASTALRIVARMNREWMITGRRPAGICGAGLLIAAKMHKFRRTEAQIAQVVRICDGTLKKRLNELDETGALDMTSDEFHAMFKPGATADFVDVDGPEPEGPESSGAVTSSCAPPIVKQQRKKIAEAAKAAAEAAAAEEVAAAQLAAPTARGHQAASVQDALSGASTRESSRRAKGAGEEIPLDQLETQVRDALASDALRELDEDSEARRRFDEEHAVARAAAKAEALELAPPPPPPPPPPPQRTMAADAAAEDGAMRVLPAVEIDGTGAPVSGKQWDPVTMWDVDDDEIDAYIRTDGEAASREAIWNAMNREYLEHQEERARTAEVRGDAPVERKKRRRATDEGPASSAAEAAAKMIRQKNISNKINYALLKDFFGGDE